MFLFALAPKIVPRASLGVKMDGIDAESHKESESRAQVNRKPVNSINYSIFCLDSSIAPMASSGVENGWVGHRLIARNPKKVINN